MATPWALRWLTMLIIFALTSFAISSYAGAAPSVPSPYHITQTLRFFSSP